MAAIISAAMRAGGDDPSQFVYPRADRLVPYQRLYLQQGGRLFDRFEPRKFPHMPRL